ncbi:acylamidase [Variibacter gotjawalensis]|uniref:Acylamidase n=1 Tax=Variibacter gotjawalensis TaxID=1333996 RepID=A0A0S3PWW2_9BRAD|nr:amidase [Variibacter gotjawalensis]NIK46243.1 aspartyl-tRNA(Asn)/glutamyl-tRNA(Gln) amidotransferase subunit A [Variibacter gotjawalensis]RZS48158.1 aspartyl-tRNA(Asn)/glutamyl-tRNA(Gln) amidotransferase subunit A [Variibacter gotjawalensis]BAT60415.1 acylamidase [Variibacter gotjawalensis]
MTDFASLSAADLARLYARGEISPVDVVRDCFARIEKFNPAINAFNVLDREGALATASESEARWKKGEARGPADGIPATIKDNVWLKGFPSRRGSLTSDDAPMKEDAPATARLREAGAPILGKTTLPEFGWIGACHSPLTGITRNPWDLSRTTGGSSGGAAAAALLNLGWLHVGTDGAGSIRIPAAFTGVFGIKQSFGRVAAYPASPFSVLAHVGPLTRTVTDAATMLSVIARPDTRDMMAWNTPAPDYRIGLNDGVAGLRIAWSPKLGGNARVDPEVAAATADAAKVFADLGAHVEEADPELPNAEDLIRKLWYAVSAYIVAGLSTEKRELLDPGFAAIAKQGKNYDLHDWFIAYTARFELSKAMSKFHERYDLLLSPTMPVPAIEAGRVTPADGSYGDEWINWSPFTYPFNLTQQPAASVPCGLTKAGLPIGLQIVGPMREDALVLRAARAFESVRPFANLSAPRM